MNDEEAKKSGVTAKPKRYSSQRQKHTSHGESQDQDGEPAIMEGQYYGQQGLYFDSVCFRGVENQGWRQILLSRIDSDFKSHFQSTALYKEICIL